MSARTPYVTEGKCSCQYFVVVIMHEVSLLFSFLSSIITVFAGEIAEMNNLFSASQIPGTIPSKNRMYLNRDFIQFGQRPVTLKDISNFTVYMWDNRFVPNLTFSREHIPQINENYRLKTFGEIDYFRGQCWKSISLETKQMLTIEVKKAFRDDPNCRVVKWNEAAKLLNKDYAHSGQNTTSWKCCYGEAFSGNWHKYAQNTFMETMNIEWRVWDLPDRQCPNGFFSHMFSSTKGHHVKKVPQANAKLGKTGSNTVISGNTGGSMKVAPQHYVYQSCRDPDYLHVKEIVMKLKENFCLKGITNPSVSDIKKLLFNMTKLNKNLCSRVNTVAARARECITDNENDDGRTEPDEPGLEEMSETETECAERSLLGIHKRRATCPDDSKENEVNMQ